ncbi:MAG: hypothetical protein BroJett040_04420 [Oligoflexia bacterium]|nr:MAG: hypothetical protein BroJett040_04420 [Oligoflexia bacterium]
MKFWLFVTFTLFTELLVANVQTLAQRPEISVINQAEVASQMPLRLKDIATVTFVEHQAKMAAFDLEILPAMRADQEITYKNSELIRILKTKINESSDLAQINWTFFVPETLNIKAVKNYISSFAIQNDLLARLKSKCEECTFQIKDLKLPVITEKVEMQKWQLDLEPLKLGGSFVLPLTAHFGGKKETFWVSGVIKVMKKSAVATRQLSPGVRVQDSDIQMSLVDITFSNDALASVDEIRGQQLARAISVHQPIYKSDIKRELAIQRGQVIKAIIGNEVFEVTSQATAEEGGFVGDLIKIKNTETQKILSGQIIERGVVRIQ